MQSYLAITSLGFLACSVSNILQRQYIDAWASFLTFNTSFLYHYTRHPTLRKIDMAWVNGHAAMVLVNALLYTRNPLVLSCLAIMIISYYGFTPKTDLGHALLLHLPAVIGLMGGGTVVLWNR